MSSSISYSVHVISMHCKTPVKDGVIENADREKSKQLFSRLKEIIEFKKLYLKSNLTITILSALLKTSKKYLSSAINYHSGMNVQQFINAYRIAEAVRIITEQGIENGVDDIVHRSGFNSRSTFYRVFTEVTGITPIEFNVRSKLSRTGLATEIQAFELLPNQKNK